MAAVSLELEAYKRKAARPLGDCIINGDLEGVKAFFQTHSHFKADQLCWTEKFHADAVTPALIAVACNNLEIFKYLVEIQKASIDIPVNGLNGMEGNEMTLLHFACLDSKKLAFVKYLLEKGAKVNAEDRWGWTPLHLASYKGHKEIVMNLLVEGADVKALDADGESPLDKARRGQHKLVLSLLGWQGATHMQQRQNVVEKFSIKMSFLGCGGVGKTSLLKRFFENSFNENTSPTVGAFNFIRPVKLGSLQYSISFCDIGGNERYHHIAPVYYRGSSIIVVVFDVTRADTYRRAQDWILELQSVCHPQSLVVLCGNKVDLKDNREVSSQEVQDFAVAGLGYLYIETSAKNDRCVQEMIFYALKQYAQLIGRFARTSDLPVLAKKEIKAAKSALCLFSDLRTGKHLQHRHDAPVLLNASKCGYLQKEGHFFLNWKRRWFEIQGESLYYYADRGYNFRGSISIRDATITAAENSPYPHSFQILTRQLNATMHDKYVIAADNDVTMKEWIAAIEQERVQFTHERESIRFRVDSEIPIPPEPITFPLVVECDSKALTFSKESFYMRYPLATYPLNKDLFVRTDIKNPKAYYISDDETFLLQVVDTEGTRALLDFLRANLSSSTTFCDMSLDDYLRCLITAYEYACHRLQIPSIHPLLQIIAQHQMSREPIEHLVLSGIRMTSRDVEAVFYGLRWYPHCDEVAFNGSGLDSTALCVLVEEAAANRNLKALDLSNNHFTEDAAQYFVDLVRREIEIESLNISKNDLKVAGVSQLLDAIAYQATTCSIREIDISFCGLDDSIVDAVTRLLVMNNRVHSIFCRGNRLTNVTGNAILEALKTKNFTVCVLDLSGNNEMDEALERNIYQLLKRNQARRDTRSTDQFVAL